MIFRHRGINLFLRTYRNIWLGDENVGQEIMIEDLTVSLSLILSIHYSLTYLIIDYPNDLESILDLIKLISFHCLLHKYKVNTII